MIIIFSYTINGKPSVEFSFSNSQELGKILGETGWKYQEAVVYNVLKNPMIAGVTSKNARTLEPVIKLYLSDRGIWTADY